MTINSSNKNNNNNSNSNNNNINNDEIYIFRIYYSILGTLLLVCVLSILNVLKT